MLFHQNGLLLMPDVNFRRSCGGDAETVCRLTSAAVARLAPETYPQEVVATWMVGRSPADYAAACAAGEMWLAEIPEGPAGFAHAVPGELIRLFVDARCHGSGIGAGLMQRALQDAIPAGGGTVRIDATLNAVPFYRRWGLQEQGRGCFPGRAGLPDIEVIHLAAEFPARESAAQ